MRAPRTIVLAAAVAVLLVLAACGGGGGDDDGVASISDGGARGDATTETTLSDEEAEEALLDWVGCMRGEGIDMPDPQFDENGGVGIVIGRASADADDEGDGAARGPMDRESIEDATEVCGEPPRMGGEFTEEDREEMEEQALAFAACMRDEGVTDFPDPDFSGNGPGAGPVTRERSSDDEGRGGRAMIAGPFGEVDLSDPVVEAAFEVCGQELGGMVPAGRIGGPASSANRAG